MTPLRTSEEIVRDVLVISPAAAYALRGSVGAADLCATPIYTAYRGVNGEAVPLALSGGRYAAGYVRVSTLDQKEDGWSLPDQAERVVDFYLRRGLAFRVYSDATLSGKLPTDDKGLIRKMLASSALRYEEAYRAVFFSGDLYAADRPEMEAWLEAKLAQIRSGGSPDSYFALDLEGLDSETHKGRSRKNHGYRPGLSELMRAVNAGLVHTLALTDISRLARSQSLSAQLTDDLQARRVQVVGLIESLDWIAGQSNLGEQLTAAILTIVAEHKLREVCLNAIRGTAQSLRAGKSNGCLPHWLRRDGDGNVHLVPERADTARRVIECALSRPDRGPAALCTLLNADPGAYPPPHDGTNRRRAGRWRPGTLKAMFVMPSLTGHQEFFGRRWATLPPLVDEDTYRRLQRFLVRRRQVAGYVPTSSHLLTGLLRCPCGSFMLFMSSAWEGRKRRDYYRCYAAATGGGAGPGWHVQLRAEEAERFFTDLVRCDARVLLDAHRHGAERALLEAEGERLRVGIEAARGRLQATLENARERAAGDLRRMGRHPSPELVTALADADPETAAASETVTVLERDRDQQEHLLRTLVPSEHMGDIEERARRWDSLSDAGRNDLLRRLIHQVHIVRDGEREYFEIVPNTPSRRPLPPVNFRLVRHGWGVTRLLPGVAEWVASW